MEKNKTEYNFKKDKFTILRNAIDPKVNEFVYNYFLALSSTLMSALICSVAYSGYIDVKTFEPARELKSYEE